MLSLLRAITTVSVSLSSANEENNPQTRRRISSSSALPPNEQTLKPTLALPIYPGEQLHVTFSFFLQAGEQSQQQDQRNPWSRLRAFSDEFLEADPEVAWKQVFTEITIVPCLVARTAASNAAIEKSLLPQCTRGADDAVRFTREFPEEIGAELLGGPVKLFPSIPLDPGNLNTTTTAPALSQLSCSLRVDIPQQFSVLPMDSLSNERLLIFGVYLNNPPTIVQCASVPLASALFGCVVLDVNVEPVLALECRAQAVSPWSVFVSAEVTNTIKNRNVYLNGFKVDLESTWVEDSVTSWSKAASLRNHMSSNVVSHCVAAPHHQRGLIASFLESVVVLPLDFGESRTASSTTAGTALESAASPSSSIIAPHNESCSPAEGEAQVGMASMMLQRSVVPPFSSTSGATEMDFFQISCSLGGGTHDEDFPVTLRPQEKYNYVVRLELRPEVRFLSFVVDEDQRRKLLDAFTVSSSSSALVAAAAAGGDSSATFNAQSSATVSYAVHEALPPEMKADDVDPQFVLLSHNSSLVQEDLAQRQLIELGKRCGLSVEKVVNIFQLLEAKEINTGVTVWYETGGTASTTEKPVVPLKCEGRIQWSFQNTN